MSKQYAINYNESSMLSSYENDESGVNLPNGIMDRNYDVSKSSFVSVNSIKLDGDNAKEINQNMDTCCFSRLYIETGVKLICAYFIIISISDIYLGFAQVFGIGFVLGLVILLP